MEEVRKRGGKRLSASELIGLKRGKLTIIGLLPNLLVGSATKRAVECRCECGSVKSYLLWNVLSGNSKTCGCWRGSQNFYRRPLGMANANHAFGAARSKAVERGLEFNLTFEQWVAIARGVCTYCGRVNTQRLELKHCSGEKKGQPRCNGPFVYTGVDRVDASRGYTEDNCVPCCYQCNIAKLDWTYQEFVTWVALVHRKLFPESYSGEGTYSCAV